LKVTRTDQQGSGTRYSWRLGLQYNRARYYDPSTERWISQDPIGFASGDNHAREALERLLEDFIDQPH
jgi:RHS repeat-associated protein